MEMVRGFESRYWFSGDEVGGGATEPGYRNVLIPSNSQESRNEPVNRNAMDSKSVMDACIFSDEASSLLVLFDVLSVFLAKIQGYGKVVKKTVR